MSIKNFEVYFDCGTSKIRAAAFEKKNPKNVFYEESIFLDDHLNLKAEIQKIISLLENKTNEYLDDVNLMIDSPEMLSIGISICKKMDGSNLKKSDIQFLIQDAKQQVLSNNTHQNIIHIVIQNYKIDDIEYTFIPDDIKCNLITLDILFICLPKEIVEHYKRHLFDSNISVNKIFCTSYTKSINYKSNLPSKENISFIDMGYNKTSIVCYNKNEVIFLGALPIGGNHITKDIAQILKVDLKKAENLKLFFDKNKNFLNGKKVSIDLIQKIIFARTEEILELCADFIRLHSILFDKSNLVLMGDGSKILDNKFMEKISFSNNIDLLDETTEDICQSALKLREGLNKREVVLMPKKPKKQAFFEKLFHFFN
tara:strand:+ start:1165 stop:2274 length:1110 start_codon:yes stop_codon:yes gene_type:complete